MKNITRFIQFVVASVFIFSGFVKLIDPIGTKIKMLEYFGEDVLNLTFLNPYALQISVLLIILEFGLGIFLLFGLYKKFNVRSLLVLIAIFLFLTWYSAYYNKVTDCGCFGDAVKLSTWETFYKNVVLIILIIWLNIDLKNMYELFSKTLRTALSHLLVLSGLLLSIYTIYHIPVIDFRPYAIGKNIQKGMEIPADAPQAKFKEIWYYKVNGEVKEYATKDEPWNIPNAEFIKRKTITLSEGYTPPIHDFSIENDTDGDITNKVLNADEIYLIISAHPTEISDHAKEVINKYANKLKQENKKVIGMFSELDDGLQSQFTFPLYLTDQTTLKTMIRSNPGVIKLEKGTVVKKIPWRELD